MADGIEFLLKIDSKLDGLNAAVTGLKTAQDALKKSGEAAEHMGMKWKEVFKGEALLHFAEKAIDIIKELGAEAIKAADDEEKLIISFDALIGQSQREVTFAWLEELGRQLPGTEEDLKQMTRTMLNVGVPMDMMREALVGINDAAILGGKGIDAVTQATSEIMRRGELTSRQLRPFGLSEAEGFEKLAKATGKSTAELKKLSAAGKLDHSDLLDSVLAAVAKKEGGVLGGVSLKAGATIFEKFKDIKNAGHDLLRDFVMQMTPMVTGVLDEILGALGPDGELGATINGVFAELTSGMDKVDWVGGAKTLVTVLGDMLSALKFIVKYTMKYVDLLQGAAEWAARIYLHPFGQSQKEKDEIAKNNRLNKDFAELEEKSKKEREFMGPTQKVDSWAAQKARLAGNGIGQGMAVGVKESSGLAFDAIDVMGDTVIEKTKKKYKQHSPSKVFEDIGRNNMLGFEQGMDSGGMTIGMPDVAGGAGGRGGFSVGQVTVNVEVHADQPGASASEIAETMRLEVPTMILSAFEQLMLQEGAA